jgi:hypothetical protein
MFAVLLLQIAAGTISSGVGGGGIMSNGSSSSSSSSFPGESGHEGGSLAVPTSALAQDATEQPQQEQELSLTAEYGALLLVILIALGLMVRFARWALDMTGISLFGLFTSARGRYARASTHDTDDDDFDDDSDTDERTKLGSIRVEAVELQALERKVHVPKLLNECKVEAPILTPQLAAKHAPTLPNAVAFMDMQLLYSTAVHGARLQTMYERVRNSGPNVLVLRDSEGHVFGCYANEQWRLSQLYFGNGDVYVFTLLPETAAYRWQPITASGAESKRFFCAAKPEYIALGGGNGGFALWLDAYFREGTSMECDTFGSPSLASSPQFKCEELEVWGFYT